MIIIINGPLGIGKTEVSWKLLEKLGCSFVDYAQNTERRFYRKGQPHTYHLHLVEMDSREHLDFREALRADPDLCVQYAHLKEDLARRFKNERA